MKEILKKLQHLQRICYEKGYPMATISVYPESNTLAMSVHKSDEEFISCVFQRGQQFNVENMEKLVKFING